MTREDIAQAVWALSASLTWGTGKTFRTRERKLRLFSDVDKKSGQPYLCQTAHGDVISKMSNTPYKRIFKYMWVGYFDSSQPGVIPDVEMGLILDAIEQAFAPKVQDPGYFDSRNTLLGMVHSCFIDGEIFKDPGDIDGQAMFTVPIKVLVP